MRVATFLSTPKAGNRFLPSRLEFTLLSAFELRGQLGEGCGVTGKQFFPFGLKRGAALASLAPVGQGIVGEKEALVFWEAEELLCGYDIGSAERFAVRFAAAGLGRAVADDGAHRNQRRPPGLGLGGFDGGLDGRQVVAVHHPLHMPVVGFEALVDILGKAQLGWPVERDQVVVVQDNQLA